MLNEAHRCITRCLMDLTAKSVLFLLRPTLAIVRPRSASVHDVPRRGNASSTVLREFTDIAAKNGGLFMRLRASPFMVNRAQALKNTLVAHRAISNVAATNAAQTRALLTLAGLPHRVRPAPGNSCRATSNIVASHKSNRRSYICTSLFSPTCGVRVSSQRLLPYHPIGRLTVVSKRP